MHNPFKSHPTDIGETYCEHMWHAGKFAALMLIGGTACLIHAIFPFLFEQTASNMLFKMTEHIVNRMPKTDKRVMCLTKCIVKKNNG